MNENNTNTNIENEEVKNVIYSSSYVMNRDLFYDFSSLTYNRLKKIFLLFFCFIACVTVLETCFKILDESYEMGEILLVIPVFLLVVYLMTKPQIKRGYERSLIASGKECVVNKSLCENSIVSCADGLKREHYYNQITGLFESKNLLLLHLQHGVYIIINKQNLSANVDEVKAFLFEKCSRVWNKKFINCSNDKKWCVILLVLTIIFGVIRFVVSNVLNIDVNLSETLIL